MNNAAEQIVFITNFWGTKIIPAILTKLESTSLPGRSDVWIPDGYDGSGGYSCRKPSDISEFTGSAEMKEDVIKQWDAEKQYRGN